MYEGMYLFIYLFFIFILFYFFFFFFFFFDLGFTALSRIFHLYRADRSSKVGEQLGGKICGLSWRGVLYLFSWIEGLGFRLEGNIVLIQLD